MLTVSLLDLSHGQGYVYAMNRCRIYITRGGEDMQIRVQEEYPVDSRDGRYDERKKQRVGHPPSTLKYASPREQRGRIPIARAWRRRSHPSCPRPPQAGRQRCRTCRCSRRRHHRSSCPRLAPGCWRPARRPRGWAWPRLSSWSSGRFRPRRWRWRPSWTWPCPPASSYR